MWHPHSNRNLQMTSMTTAMVRTAAWRCVQRASKPLPVCTIPRASFSSFTHMNAEGTSPKMVDVGAKQPTRRTATARSIIRLPPEVLRELKRVGNKQHTSSSDDALALTGPKGPIGTTAIIAGVLGAKQTSSLIPFCHPLPIEDVQIRISTPSDDRIAIECEVSVTHKTGVEMEALTGASVAALCVYDMCKALSHDIVIERTELVAKTGGKRDFKRQES